MVQQAVVYVLEAIYEEDFLGFSYGFRPGCGQHDALDALHAGFTGSKLNWVLDLDIQGFFDASAGESGENHAAEEACEEVVVPGGGFAPKAE